MVMCELGLRGSVGNQVQGNVHFTAHFLICGQKHARVLVFSVHVKFQLAPNTAAFQPSDHMTTHSDLFFPSTNMNKT